MNLVRTDGSPKNIKDETSRSNRELDRAAIEAARKWRFNPAIKNGQKTEGYVRVPVAWNLNQL